jgi:hypothetical protein
VFVEHTTSREARALRPGPFDYLLQFSDSGDAVRSCPDFRTLRTALRGFRISPGGCLQLTSRSLPSGDDEVARHSNAMTDHPRFELVRSSPDQAHLSYHGGRLVDSLLRLVDQWRTRRKLRPTGECHENQMLTVSSSRCSLGAACGTWSSGPGCSQDRVGTGDQMGARAAICSAWRPGGGALRRSE